jgi:hypothetical protein
MCDPMTPTMYLPSQSVLLSKCTRVAFLIGDLFLVRDWRRVSLMRVPGHVLSIFWGALHSSRLAALFDPCSLCRNIITCDQDQWDIHKLDPFYECFVPAQPHPPTIRAKVASTPSFAWSSTSSRSSTFAEGPQKRRRFSTSPSSLEEDNGTSPKKRRHVIQVDSESDEDEIETKLNLNAPRQTPRTHVPGRRVRERRGGVRRVPMATKIRVNVQDAMPQVFLDEEMRCTPPPRTPPRTTVPPSTSKRRKGNTNSFRVSLR